MRPLLSALAGLCALGFGGSAAARGAGDRKISSRDKVLAKMGVAVRTLVVAFPR